MYDQNVYKYDEVKRAEHMAVRNSVGWYYFTHQLLEVTGPDSAAFLDHMFANPVANLAVGRDRYTTMLNEQGEIVDDVVVMRLAEDRFWVSTLYVTKLAAWFESHKGSSQVSFENVTPKYDMYSVQGPKSKDVINLIAEDGVDDLKFFAHAPNAIEGVPVRINRGGFAGEKFGYEIYVAPEKRVVIEKSLKEAADKLGGRQVKESQIMVLTLPAEKGFYLMRDLLHFNPLEVGLDQGIGWDRDFIGKEALLKIREEGPVHEMLGFTVDKADVNIHQKCFGGPGEAIMKDGDEIGRVSKFTYSYVLDKNIGYAILKKGAVRPGDHVQIHGEDAVITEKTFI